jgi:class 3 adenylate cyclase
LEIADWLRGLSLERYAETFRDNAIDVAVLPELSEADLEKLGHRKIMLRAIAALRGGAAENIAEPVPAPAPIPGEAERRQLTVMYCDLVGSTP